MLPYGPTRHAYRLIMPDMKFIMPLRCHIFPQTHVLLRRLCAHHLSVVSFDYLPQYVLARSPQAPTLPFFFVVAMLPILIRLAVLSRNRFSFACSPPCVSRRMSLPPPPLFSECVSRLM